MPDVAVHIRPLGEGDLGFANAVRGIAGWNQTLADWRRFVALEPEGCFLAECDGAPAGTATTTCYGADLAWIGMVLVHPDFRRRGIGTALLRHGIRHLRETRGIRCVKLDATPEGQPLYEKLGFVAEWGLRRWLRKEIILPDAGPPPFRGATPGDFAADAANFGADRARLLDSLAAGSFAAVFDDDGGFGLMREGSRANYLGPVSAANPETGLKLCRDLIAAAPGDRWVFWDIPDDNRVATKLAADSGFEPVRVLTRMWLGENAAPGDPARLFALAEPGLG